MPDYEFGVLFVAGIGKQRAGSTLVSFAGALHGWLFRSTQSDCLADEWAPVLRRTRLSQEGERGPASTVLEVPLCAGTAGKPAWSRQEWLLAESAWADVSDLPAFMALARWVWKVSTCLLVLQFVIPLRRHWNAAFPARVQVRAAPPRDDQPPGRLVSAAAAAGYLLLIGMAASASVLLSLLLVALAVVAWLPVPRIDQAVRAVIVKLSAVLGDSYLLAHCPVQYAAMRARVARDLEWLQSQCETVAVVAHSQGAAIAHQVLRDRECALGGVRSFVTLGQGIAKLHLLQRLDWDTDARFSALWSRLLVTAGLLAAGLPLAFVLAGVRAVVPVRLGLLAAGLAAIWAGVWFALRAVGPGIQADVLLPAADGQLTWTDYYASADPVSNGRLIYAPSGISEDNGSRQRQLPARCYEVYNRGSLLTDHNSYLQNQDQCVSQVVSDLAAVALPGAQPEAVVTCAERERASRRRRRLVDWLIGARLASVAIGVSSSWWLATALPVQAGMKAAAALSPLQLISGTDIARAAVAALAALAAYILAGVIPWSVMQVQSRRRFFADYFAARPDPRADRASTSPGIPAETALGPALKTTA